MKSSFSVENDSPRVVEISYGINCVSNISAATSTYEIDVNLYFHWIEPLAIGRNKKKTLDLEAEGLFDPDIRISNEHELEILNQSVKLVNSQTGEIKCSLHCRGSLFITSMSLELFPFDYQNLNIVLKPKKIPSSQLILSARGPEHCAFNRSVVHEWHVLGHFMRSYFTDPQASSARKEYSVVFITVLGRRQPGWFINNVFLISSLLLFYTWTLHLLDLVR